MKSIIKNILKEEVKNKPTIGKSVFLIMHKSGELAFTKFLTYGTYWVELDNYTQIENIKFSKEIEAKQFLNLVIHCFNNPEKICGYKLQYEEQREVFNPKDWEVVEYIMGLTPKQDVTDIFGGLNESKRKSEYQYKKGDIVTVDGYVSGKFFNNNIGTILGFWAGQFVVLFENWHNRHKGPSFPYDPKPVYTKCGKDSCWLIPFNNQNDGNRFTIEVSPFNELDMGDIFNQLKEEFNPEDLGWAEELAGELPNEIGEPRLTKDGMNLILTDGAVSMLTGLGKSDVKNKEQRTLRNYTTNNTLPYKKMRYKKDGSHIYSMDVSFKKTGDNQWIVIGRSGDFGWGDWFYSKKHIFGKRIRSQIFKQVLSDFKEVVMK